MEDYRQSDAYRFGTELERTNEALGAMFDLLNKIHDAIVPDRGPSAPQDTSVACECGCKQWTTEAIEVPGWPYKVVDGQTYCRACLKPKTENK